MPAPGDSVTLLLAQLRDGNQEAANQLIPLIYTELRRMAAAYLQRERPGHTLQATAVVHEAYIRLADGQQGPWQNRAHFFASAPTPCARFWWIMRAAGKPVSSAAPARERWRST